MPIQWISLKSMFGNQCNNENKQLKVCSLLGIGTWHANWSTINSQLMFTHVIWSSILGWVRSSMPPLGLGLGGHVFSIRNRFLQRPSRHTSPDSGIKYVWLHLQIGRNGWNSWPSGVIQCFVSCSCAQFRFRCVLCICKQSWWANIILKAKSILYNLKMINNALCRPTIISLLQANARHNKQVSFKQPP